MALIAIACCTVTGATWAQRPLRHALFDFEGGIEGWWGNVYGGGGTCKPSVATEAKFGTGALHCEVRGVEGGSNTVSAWFPQDAEWRKYGWGLVSFWVRGDGSRDEAKLSIATGFESEQQQSYSYPVPLDGTEWRKIEARIGSFWNRYDIPMDVPRIGRIMFGCNGTHSFDIDHIVLEAPQRAVPLDAIDPPRGVDLKPSLVQSQDGRYVLQFDPTPLLPGPTHVEALVPGPQGERRIEAGVDGRPARDEVLLEWDDPKQDRRAPLSLIVRRASQQEVAFAHYEFDLVTPKEPPDPTPLGLVPAPKQIRLGEGSFPITAATRLHVIGADGADDTPAVNLLTDELQGWLSQPIQAARTDAPGKAAWSEILLGQGPAPSPKRPEGPTGQLPQGGYTLDVTERGVRIAARDTSGLVNGVCTLLQAIESHYAGTFELAAPAMEVVDWPSLPIRAVSIPLPTSRWGYPNDAPVSEEFFTDFLRRTVVRHKLNTAVLIVEQAMQYQSHPKVSGPAAWPKETVKRIFDTLRRYGVEPVPCCNSLGHANWLAIPYRELAEDGDVHQFCTSNPNSKRILLEIYQEIVDLVQPKYFHIGMDEIRWNTHTLPEEQRCTLCAGRDKRDIFVEWVTMLHDFFTRQGIEVMMWGDMLVREHNGGVPYHLADTIDRLPKDIIICNWSKSRAPVASHWFRSHGFERVIRANSLGVTPQEQHWVVGNMVGIWNKVSWLQDTPATTPNTHAYPSILVGAEYSWNPWPDLSDPSVPLSDEFFAKRPQAQMRVALDPVPGAKAPQSVSLTGAAPIEGLPVGALKFGGLSFQPDGRALAPEAGQSATVEIGRPVAALYFLHAAEVEDAEALREGLKAAESWEGVHIGSYEIEYASGQTASVPIRYPMEVRSPPAGSSPVSIAYRALGVHPVAREAESKHVYAVQWVNPRPDDRVERVTVKAIDARARPVLVGVAVQEVAE